MEYWDVLDETGQKTGRLMRRSGDFAPGDYMLAVHIFLQDEAGLYLVQKRAACKLLHPGVWDVTCGAVVAGEQSLDAAARELQEEVGIAPAPDRFRLFERVKGRHSFADLWTVRCPFALEDCILEPEEVEEVRLVTGGELCRMMDALRYKSDAYRDAVRRLVKASG